MTSDILADRLGRGMSDSEAEILSIRDHFKEMYMAAERWPEAGALAVEDFTVRRVPAEHEDDGDFIAAPRNHQTADFGREVCVSV